MSRSSSDPQSGPPTDPRDRLATEAVIASYIHAISDRHRRSDEPQASPRAPAVAD
jgi:hypothetical protein